jgi:HAD superfamily hydrolase (TIGR01509 family)
VQGLRKPEKEAYERVLETLNLIESPSRCIFIDDRLVNVEAAIACGIDAILFVDAESLMKELEKRGILLDNV